MPRTVQITLPSKDTGQVVQKITSINGLLGLRVHHGISLKPPGDVISLEITNNALEELMWTLDKEGMLDNPDISVSTAQPSSILSNTSSKKITTDGSETTWEETLSIINEQSHMTVNNIISMFLSGIIAVLGIMTNAVHVVIGASLLAPGFGAISASGYLLYSNIAYTGWGSLVGIGVLLAGVLLQVAMPAMQESASLKRE